MWYKIVDILLLLMGVWFIFKINDFKVKILTLIFLYPLFPLVLLSYGFEATGIVEAVGLKYYGEYLVEAKYYAFLYFYTYAALIFPFRKMEIQFKYLNLSFFIRVLLLALIIITALNSYPRAFFLADYRWNLLKIGNTQVLYLALTVIFLLSSKKIRLLEKTHMLLLIFIIIRGERAENLFTLIFYFVFIINRVKQKNAMFIWATGILAFLGLLGELLRSEKTMTLKLFGERLGKSIFFQSTATDVLHVYLSSFYYHEQVGLNFKPMVNELMSFIPLAPEGGAGGQYNFTEILRDVVPNPGGGIFYTEGIVMLGPFGGWLYSLIFGLLIICFYKWSFSRTFWSVLGVIIFLLPLRTLWYGFVYVPSTLVVSYFFYLIFQKLNNVKIIFSNEENHK